MQPNEAAEVLRGNVWRGEAKLSEARGMGAEALEILAWADSKECPEPRKVATGRWIYHTRWGDIREYDTLLDLLRDAKKASAR